MGAGYISETGDTNAVFFLFKDGSKTKLSLTQEVAPGAVIYVGKNPWEVTKETIANILIITGFVSEIIALTVIIWNLIDRF